MTSQSKAKNSPFIKTRAQAKNKSTTDTHSIGQVGSKNTKLKITHSPFNANANKHNLTNNTATTSAQLTSSNANINEKNGKDASYNIAVENYKHTLEINERLDKDNRELKRENLLIEQISEVLEPSTWLTDDSINLYFEILSSKVLGPISKISLINPSVCQAIKMYPQDVKSLLDPLQLEKSELLILAVNDSVEKEAEGGMHWSLLLFSKINNIFYSYDSLLNTNAKATHEVVTALSSYFLMDVPQIVPLVGPSQTNVIDCGLYVLLATEYIIQCEMEDKLDFYSKPLPSFNHQDCINKRSTLLYAIINRKKLSRDQLIKLMNKNHTCVSQVAVKSHEAATNSWEKVSKPSCRENIHRHAAKQNFEITCSNKYACLSEAQGNDEEKSFDGCKSHQYSRKPTIKLTTKRSSQNLNRKGVFLVADSQGNDLAYKLQNVMGDSFNVFGHVQPGALLSKVVQPLMSDLNSRSYDDKDWIIIVGGCNDLSDIQKDKNVELYSKDLISTLETQINSYTNASILISTIPYRYDLHNGDHRQNVIVKVNEEIKKLVYKYSHAHLLDLWLLERFYHTKHGFHISKKGKSRVAELIHEIVVGKDEKLNAGLNFQNKSECSGIQVIDQDMSDVFRKRGWDSRVAFAHCISGDFGHERQMTAGVAVKFQKEFGKPTVWDCIQDHLTYQKSGDGAGVYGLITKLHYDGKPSLKDYDEAFKQLIASFKNKNYKHLICSPLGCVRDKIPLKHFISNIVQFHQETGATIEIVTYKQNSARRILNNGLSHEQFINTINALLNMEIKPKLATTPEANNKKNSTSTESLSPSSPWRGWSTPEPSICSIVSPGANHDRLQLGESVVESEQDGESEIKKQSSVLSELEYNLNNKQSFPMSDRCSNNLKSHNNSFL